jgi:serine/threonine-protein kinase
LSLVDVAANRQLRTRTSQFDTRDPAVIRDSTVDSLIGMLQLKVTSADRQSLAVHDSPIPAARELYMQARGYLQDYDKPENIDRTIAVFGDALTLDPDYALAYAGLGEAYLIKYGRTNESSLIMPGQKACEEALKRDATLGAAHNCLGTVYSDIGKDEDAIRELRRAIAIEPTNDDYYRELARIQQKFGNKDDAEKTFRQAISIRPHYWANYNALGVFYFSNTKYEEASEMFKQVVSLAPDGVFGYSNLGGAYVQLGRYNDAIPMFQRSAAIRPNASAYSNLATAYFNRRRFLESARTFEEAIKINDKSYTFCGLLADEYN